MAVGVVYPLHCDSENYLPTVSRLHVILQPTVDMISTPRARDIPVIVFRKNIIHHQDEYHSSQIYAHTNNNSLWLSDAIDLRQH